MVLFIENMMERVHQVCAAVLERAGTTGEGRMDYQWYPGHMTKARRRMQENLKLVDLVIELTDARTVRSGRNPDIDAMASGKKRILVLTKADLADPKINEEWVSFYMEQGILTAAMDARKSGNLRQIRALVAKAAEEKIARDRKRGIVNRPVRAMVVGIPNVGKSTFINAYAGRASAKTGNRPGVTKGEQWIRPDGMLELLDTPGILWPKFEDQSVGLRLSLTGTIRDEILDHAQMAGALAEFLMEHYPGTLSARYQVPEDGKEQALLEAIAIGRKLVGSGGEPDIGRACSMLIDDFRSGRLGRISLERP